LSQCNRCGLEITWKKPFTHGDRPLNMDNSVHSCKKETASESPKTPEITPSSILDECEAFRIRFGAIESDARFDALARIYNTLRMRK